jgi:succinate dehydrogenase/fumarate reductase flavoprotein subunit
MPRYDLVVIESGPAGQRAAVQAAKPGKRVAVIERQRVVAFENSSGIGFRTGATRIVEGK